MCLSAVYNKSSEENNLLCKNVMKINIDGEKIRLLDIMQSETNLIGKIVSADLVNGVVIVDCQA
ncbi:MAG: CooT family nickel-binding protein [Oscillospiraceae bacterium]